MVDPTDLRAVLADYLPGHPAVTVQRFDSGPDNIAFRARFFSHMDRGIEHVLVDPVT